MNTKTMGGLVRSYLGNSFFILFRCFFSDFDRAPCSKVIVYFTVSSIFYDAAVNSVDDKLGFKFRSDPTGASFIVFSAAEYPCGNEIPRIRSIVFGDTDKSFSISLISTCCELPQLLCPGGSISSNKNGRWGKSLLHRHL